MRFDDLNDKQMAQVRAKFGATPLTGNDLRQYDYEIDTDGNVLSRRYLNDTIQFTDGDKTLALVQLQAARIASLEQQLAAAEANAAETERVASYYESQSVGWSKKAHELEQQLAAAQERERATLTRIREMYDLPNSDQAILRQVMRAIDAALAAAQKGSE